jgi:hypothetical protein
MQIMKKKNSIDTRNFRFEAMCTSAAGALKLLKKAIKIAQKGDWERVFTEFDDLETIVDISGHAIRDSDYDNQNPNRNNND